MARGFPRVLPRVGSAVPRSTIAVEPLMRTCHHAASAWSSSVLHLEHFQIPKSLITRVSAQEVPQQLQLTNTASELEHRVSESSRCFPDLRVDDFINRQARRFGLDGLKDGLKHVGGVGSGSNRQSQF